MSNIKRAVSLYSLQDKYARGKMSLEDLFGFLREIDVEGVEFISDQMMHGTPHPSEESLKNWDRLIGKYNLKPVCNDIFINTTLYKNRVLTTKESTKLLVDEIKLANRMGFDLIRLVSKTPPEIIEPALEEAEKKQRHAGAGGSCGDELQPSGNPGLYRHHEEAQLRKRRPCGGHGDFLSPAPQDIEGLFPGSRNESGSRRIH